MQRKKSSWCDQQWSGEGREVVSGRVQGKEERLGTTGSRGRMSVCATYCHYCLCVSCLNYLRSFFSAFKFLCCACCRYAVVPRTVVKHKHTREY